jgi:DNA-binding CsgD family transcriptional regulator
VDRQVARLAAVLLERVDELAEALAQRLLTEVTAYVDSMLVPPDELRDDCRAQLRSILPALDRTVTADTSHAEQSGRRRAAQGVPLAMVMEAYRLAGRFVWETLVSQAETTSMLDSDALVRAASTIWQILDSFTHAMASTYRDALTERIVAHEHERSALVAALLDGRITEHRTLWETAEILGISRRGPYLVVAAELPDVGRRAFPDVEAQLRAHGLSSAWRLLPDLQVGIVVLPRGQQLEPLLLVLNRHARHRVGVSPPYQNLDRTSEAVQFAKIAMSSTTSTSALVTVFDSSPLAVTAASAPEVMTRVVRAILGPLEKFPPGERAILLDTLEAWRDCGGSTEQTAKQLYCHPNTVRHRLRRITDATGRTLTAPQDIAELCLALEAARQQSRQRGTPESVSVPVRLRRTGAGPPPAQIPVR